MQLLPQQIERLDGLLAQVMKDGKAVGMAVSAFDAAGNIIYQRMEGFRDSERGLPLDENTVMGLASITKSFTALSIVQLAERGLIDLAAPVARYVPQFEKPGITVGHLLCHSAGFFPLARLLVGDVAAEMGLSFAKDGELARHPALAREGAARLVGRMNSQARMNGRPGEFFSYSNDSFALLSDIVMGVSGAATYADYIRENILAPLGMGRSGCDFEWPGDGNVTKLYQEEEGRMTDHHDFYNQAYVLMGEGNMRSTIADMRKYVAMYLNHGMGAGGRVAGAYWVREMTKPRQISGLNEYYGYGLNIRPEGEISVISHGGNLTGVASQMAWCYETGVGVVAISNTSGTPVSRLTKAIMRVCAGMEAEAEKGPAVAQWPEDLLEKACGEYASDEGLTFVIGRRGGLPTVTLNGEELAASVINQYMLRLRVGANDLTAALYLDDAGQVWAIDAGLRIIPKKGYQRQGG